MFNTVSVAQDTMMREKRPQLPFHQPEPVEKTKTFQQRQWMVGGTSAIVYGGALIYLNEAWYKDYPRSGFHSFDDSREWKQVDKVGHSWSAYNLSRATASAWNWALGKNETKRKKAVWLGSLSGFGYLTVIEVLDAHSAEWGWSWSDMAANGFGAGLFASQELLWEQQKIQFKFSSHRADYEASLLPRVNELYGASVPERLLKDYNAQTYWFSANLKSFFPRSSLPPWLNLSVGYGAQGMFGGFDNIDRDKNGNVTFDRRDIPRYRQWYLSPDIDLTKIRTKSKFLKTAFFALNAIKFPTPALEFSNQKFHLRAIAF